jgi:hypothetical protein
LSPRGPSMSLQLSQMEKPRLYCKTLIIPV